MSNLIDDDGIDDFSENDDHDHDEDFKEPSKVFKKKKRTKREIRDCHFCGKNFFAIRKEGGMSKYKSILYPK